MPFPESIAARTFLVDVAVLHTVDPKKRLAFIMEEFRPYAENILAKYNEVFPAEGKRDDV